MLDERRLLPWLFDPNNFYNTAGELISTVDPSITNSTEPYPACYLEDDEGEVLKDVRYTTGSAILSTAAPIAFTPMTYESPCAGGCTTSLSLTATASAGAFPGWREAIDERILAAVTQPYDYYLNGVNVSAFGYAYAQVTCPSDGSSPIIRDPYSNTEWVHAVAAASANSPCNVNSQATDIKDVTGPRLCTTVECKVTSTDPNGKHCFELGRETATSCERAADCAQEVLGFAADPETGRSLSCGNPRTGQGSAYCHYYAANTNTWNVMKNVACVDDSDCDEALVFPDIRGNIQDSSRGLTCWGYGVSPSAIDIDGRYPAYSTTTGRYKTEGNSDVEASSYLAPEAEFGCPRPIFGGYGYRPESSPPEYGSFERWLAAAAHFAESRAVECAEIATPSYVANPQNLGDGSGGYASTALGAQLGQTFAATAGELLGIEVSVAKGVKVRSSDSLELRLYDARGRHLGTSVLSATALPPGTPGDLNSTALGSGVFDFSGSGVSLASEARYRFSLAAVDAASERCDTTLGICEDAETACTTDRDCRPDFLVTRVADAYRGGVALDGVSERPAYDLAFKVLLR